MNTETLIRQLGAEGLLDADAACEAVEGRAQGDVWSHTPLSLRVLGGIGGWIAALSFFACLGVLLSDALTSAGLIVGAVLIGVATLVRRVPVAAGARDLVHQASLATVMVGRFAVWATIGEWDWGVTLVAAFVLEVTLLAVYPDPAHRALSAWGAVSALMMWVDEVAGAVGAAVVAPGIAAATLVLLHQERAALLRHLGPAHGPALAGLTAATLAMPEALWFRDADARLLAAGGAAVVASAGLLDLARRHGASERPPVALAAGAGCVALALTAWWAPSLPLAVTLAVVGRYRQHPWLVGLAASAVALDLTALYYRLNLPFQAKAAAMIGAGIVLLGARHLLVRPSEEVA